MRIKPVSKNLSDFLLNMQEILALDELKEEINVYMLQKVAVAVK